MTELPDWVISRAKKVAADLSAKLPEGFHAEFDFEPLMRPYSPLDVELTQLIFERHRQVITIEDYLLWLSLLNQRGYFWLFWTWRKLGWTVVDSSA